MQIASKWVYANLKHWKMCDSWPKKLKTWEEAVHSRVFHGNGTWELNKERMGALRKWESKLMRKAFCMRRKVILVMGKST